MYSCLCPLSSTFLFRCLYLYLYPSISICLLGSCHSSIYLTSICLAICIAVCLFICLSVLLTLVQLMSDKSYFRLSVLLCLSVLLSTICTYFVFLSFFCLSVLLSSRCTSLSICPSLSICTSFIYMSFFRLYVLLSSICPSFVFILFLRLSDLIWLLVLLLVYLFCIFSINAFLLICSLARPVFFCLFALFPILRPYPPL